MKILDLSLTYHWYDEITSGRKKEEYRRDKPFYRKRLIAKTQNAQIRFPLCNSTPYTIILRHYDAVRFHRGQGSRTTMLVECKEISFGYGNPEWGAPVFEEVFIIRLGRILSETSGAQLHSRKE